MTEITEPARQMAADLADAEAVQRMVEAVIKQMGGLHVLVNNAAIYEDHAIATVDYDTWQTSWLHTIQTNLLGAANATYCAAQHMMRQGGGRIVNVSSRGAFLVSRMLQLMVPAKRA